MSMRLNAPPKTLKSHQMGNFMNQSESQPVFIKTGIYCDLMLTVGEPSIITMPGYPMIYDF